MRLAWVAWLAVAACGSEDGSILTIRAPEGPDAVARLEIVLAADGRVDTVDDQRKAPRDFAGVEAVRYYRQRATAGVIEAVGRADGFTLRIEPNIAMVPEQTFVPFLVAYDADGGVIGVGAVLDEDREPASITIEGGAARKYFVDMVPLAPMDPALGMGDRESMRVLCGAWTSGIAWRPAATQLRLLLADREAGATDASERALDLDCDGHAADESDCDDLRSVFHAGRQEACDGMDQNCDGARTTVQACTDVTCAAGGVQLCDDRTGEPIGGCQQNASCACSGGGPCAYCALSYKPTTNPAKQTPCAPASGKLKFPACIEGAACTIDVLSATPPWTAYLSNNPTMGFTTRITVMTGDAYIELKSGDVTGQAGDSVGTLHLMVTQGGQSRLVSVDIQLFENTPCTTIPGSSLYAMSCGP
jgi:Putative metal-binding motif